MLVIIGCNTNPIEIRVFKDLGNDLYLVAFKEKFLFSKDYYKVTISNGDQELFLRTFDQHNIFFEIKDFDKFEQINDTILVYSDLEPIIRIEEKRSFAFVFISPSTK